MKDLIQHASAKSHTDEDDFFADLQNYDIFLRELYEKRGRDHKKTVFKSDRKDNFSDTKKPDGTLQSKNDSDTKGIENSRVNGGPKCFTCNEMGHFSRKCFKKACSRCAEKGHTYRECTKPATTPKEDIRSLAPVSQQKFNKYIKSAFVNGKEVRVMVDTGCTVCTIRASTVLANGFAMKLRVKIFLYESFPTTFNLMMCSWDEHSPINQI